MLTRIKIFHFTFSTFFNKISYTKYIIHFFQFLGLMTKKIIAEKSVQNKNNKIIQNNKETWLITFFFAFSISSWIVFVLFTQLTVSSSESLSANFLTLKILFSIIRFSFFSAILALILSLLFFSVKLTK